MEAEVTITRERYLQLFSLVEEVQMEALFNVRALLIPTLSGLLLETTYVSVSSIKKWYVVFFIFAGSSSIIAFVADTKLCKSAIRTNTLCGVKYVACHVQVALLPWSQWCSDWCALSCSAAVAFGCVCLSHVSGWVTLIAVFAVVTTWSVLLSVVSGGRILRGPLKSWGAGRLFHGIRLQAAAASCAHVSCSGGREQVAWVQMQSTRNRHFLVF